MTTLMLSFIIFLSGFIQGMTSFGFSLIALPLLGLFISIKTIVPILVIFSFFINSIIFYNIKAYVDFQRIKYLVIAGMIGTPFGAKILLMVDEFHLKIAVGILIIFAAIIMKLGLKFPVKNEKLGFIPVGFASGLLNGSVSLSGPPIILFLTNQGTKKNVFRANLTTFFLILNIFTIPIFFYNSIITMEVIKLSGVLLPSLIVGVFTGIKLGNTIDNHVFENLTLTLVSLMGIITTISTLKN